MALEQPDTKEGIEYWETQPASYDGVLGGFGAGSLPRIESLGSRLFLLNLYPELSTVPSAFKSRSPPDHVRRVRALDVGAGVGRVTSDTLLYLVSDVVLLEPVEPFVQEALKRARASASGNAVTTPEEHSYWPGLADQTKSVTLLRGTIQEFDPLNPHRVHFLDRIGYQSPRPADEIRLGFDIIWCQWCLGHLSDIDLVAFLRRSHAALRKDNPSAIIVVKENLCPEQSDGTAQTVFDEQDSSLTRYEVANQICPYLTLANFSSDLAWKNLFKLADLTLIQEEVQEGLPEGLYVVKMYALQ